MNSEAAGLRTEQRRCRQLKSGGEADKHIRGVAGNGMGVARERARTGCHLMGSASQSIVRLSAEGCWTLNPKS